MSKVKSVLIIATKTLVMNWKKEFDKWAPTMKVSVFDNSESSNQRLKNLRRVQGSGGVLLTTYNLGRIHQEILSSAHNNKRFVWDYVILDEGHLIKNPTQTTKALFQVPSVNRLCITGTPIQNKLSELWMLYDFVSKGTLLGSYKTFKEQYEIPIMRAREKGARPAQIMKGLKIAENLRQIYAPYFLRRTKKEVLGKPGEGDSALSRLLPKKTDWVVWVKLSDIQLSFYADFLELPDVSNWILSGDKRNALVKLLVMKKICDHPRLLTKNVCERIMYRDKKLQFLPTAVNDEDDVVKIDHVDVQTLMKESGKLAFCMDLLENLRKEGHKVLLFSRSSKILDIIQKILSERKWRVARLDGSVVSVKKREQIINTFQKDATIPVCLLTSQVGGVGLTLTSADRVIIYDPSWNPATDSQAIDRAYRIGQEREVIVYRLITCGTVEEKIYRRQVYKNSLTRQTVEFEKDPTRYFSDHELRELFEFKNPEISLTFLQLVNEHKHIIPQTDSNMTHLKKLQNFSHVYDISDHGLLFTNEEPEQSIDEELSKNINRDVEIAHTAVANECTSRRRKLIEDGASHSLELKPRFFSNRKDMDFYVPQENPTPLITISDDEDNFVADVIPNKTANTHNTNIEVEEVFLDTVKNEQVKLLNDSILNSEADGPISNENSREESDESLDEENRESSDEESGESSNEESNVSKKEVAAFKSDTQRDLLYEDTPQQEAEVVAKMDIHHSEYFSDQNCCESFSDVQENVLIQEDTGKESENECENDCSKKLKKDDRSGYVDKLDQSNYDSPSDTELDEQSSNELDSQGKNNENNCTTDGGYGEEDTSESKKIKMDYNVNSNNEIREESENSVDKNGNCDESGNSDDESGNSDGESDKSGDESSNSDGESDNSGDESSNSDDESDNSGDESDDSLLYPWYSEKNLVPKEKRMAVAACEHINESSENATVFDGRKSHDAHFDHLKVSATSTQSPKPADVGSNQTNNDSNHLNSENMLSEDIFCGVNKIVTSFAEFQNTTKLDESINQILNDLLQSVSDNLNPNSFASNNVVEIQPEDENVNDSLMASFGYCDLNANEVNKKGDTKSVENEPSKSTHPKYASALKDDCAESISNVIEPEANIAGSLNPSNPVYRRPHQPCIAESEVISFGEMEHVDRKKTQVIHSSVLYQNADDIVKSVEKVIGDLLDGVDSRVKLQTDVTGEVPNTANEFIVCNSKTEEDNRPAITKMKTLKFISRKEVMPEIQDDAECVVEVLESMINIVLNGLDNGTLPFEKSFCCHELTVNQQGNHTAITRQKFTSLGQSNKLVQRAALNLLKKAKGFKRKPSSRNTTSVIANKKPKLVDNEGTVWDACISSQQAHTAKIIDGQVQHSRKRKHSGENCFYNSQKLPHCDKEKNVDEAVRQVLHNIMLSIPYEFTNGKVVRNSMECESEVERANVVKILVDTLLTAVEKKLSHTHSGHVAKQRRHSKDSRTDVTLSFNLSEVNVKHPNGTRDTLEMAAELSLNTVLNILHDIVAKASSGVEEPVVVSKANQKLVAEGTISPDKLRKHTNVSKMKDASMTVMTTGDETWSVSQSKKKGFDSNATPRSFNATWWKGRQLLFGRNTVACDIKPLLKAATLYAQLRRTAYESFVFLKSNVKSTAVLSSYQQSAHCKNCSYDFQANKM